MKKSILSWTKTTYVVTFILFLLCFTFSCKQQVEEGITEEEAKALVEKELEIWNEGNLALADELFAPDYVLHEVDISEDRVGIDAYKEYVIGTRTMFPDYNLTTEEIIVKDDKIVWRWTCTGTNTGPMGDIPPTGKKVRFSGVCITRVVNGKGVERLVYRNEAAFLIKSEATAKVEQPSGDNTYLEILAKLYKYWGKLEKVHPDAMKSLEALIQVVYSPGALDTKTKELITLGIAVAVRCDECIASHTLRSLEAGATEEEIVETLGVAMLMGGGPSIGYATHAMEALEQFKATEK